MRKLFLWSIFAFVVLSSSNLYAQTCGTIRYEVDSEEINCCAVEDGDWTNNVTEGGCEDLATGLIWGMRWNNWNWADANTKCANNEEGGFTDWRLATRAEMYDAVDDGAGTHLSYGWNGLELWSSEKKANKAYTVELFDGDEYLRPQIDALSFACIRDPNGGNNGGGCKGKGCN